MRNWLEYIPFITIAKLVRAYPALKRGLGYGQACSATRLEV